ncbi:hypothetical protein BDW74DRAFT_182438 [Aspergillus multicolor]|uniref:uncharacterized protein n=1 Tax=Aspergillus multicolor TaxID=41759 RepID=UPI003CCD5B42
MVILRLFGLSSAEELPGLAVYMRQVENRLWSDACKRKLWLPAGEKASVIWIWCHRVLEALEHVQTIHGIDATFDQMISELAPPIHPLDTATRGSIICASLCVLTGLIDPTTLEVPEAILPGNCQFVAKHQEDAAWCRANALDGSIRWAFRVIPEHMFVLINEGTETQYAELNELVARTLDSGYLRDARKVELKLVDTLTEHMVFQNNGTSWVLSIFRYPSLCLAHLRKDVQLELGPYVACALQKTLIDDIEGGDPPPVPTNEVFKEIILSYRLLFSQSERASKLLKQALNEEPDKQDPFLLYCALGTPPRSPSSEQRRLQ